MSVDPQQIRSEEHGEVGAVLQRDCGVIIQRWSARAVREQPHGQRVHHEALLDHLPGLLQDIGRSLADSDENSTPHEPTARRHGEERWEAGWSLPELVRDFQILRLVILEYLEEALDRPVTGREAMAIGLALDEAIAASIVSYDRHRQEAVRRAEREHAEREHRQIEARQRQEADALTESNRRKDLFLATLGHELRNPLAPIHNAVQILRLKGADGPTVHWASDLLERQVRHMSRLVDELLDISRIGRGKMLLRSERVDLVQLVRSTAEDERTSFETAGLNLRLALPPRPLPVSGDATRLSQVLRNLLTNAAKFTDPGGEVEVRVLEKPAEQRIEVSVTDNGIGIDPAMQAHVFESFAQVDRAVNRSRGGLGLGLALVKGFVELHGGGVAVRSGGRGTGSTFTFWLPQTAEAATTAQPPTRLATTALRVLVIEDNADAADSLHILLELMGHHVTLAYTGPDGIEAARQAPPDVLLCSLGIDGMSAFAVARALRERPETAKVRLIAVSGLNTEADQAQCRAAGFDVHLTKPIDPNQLQNALSAVPSAGAQAAK